MSVPSIETTPRLALSRGEVAALAVILVYSFIPAVGGLVRIVELAGGPALVPFNPRAASNPWPIVAHGLASFMFCIFGALQFMPTLRRRTPALHQSMGRVVAFSGCIAAATGVWMTHAFSFPPALQGCLLYGVRMVLGTVMAGLIVWAVLGIRRGNVGSHRAAMLRAYAIGQGASTQTVLGLAWVGIVGTDLEGELRDGMMVLAWAINLSVAERMIGNDG